MLRSRGCTTGMVQIGQHRFSKTGFNTNLVGSLLLGFAPHGTVRGIISAHVDDFVFSGSDTDQEWQDILQAIRTEFKWSDWETKAFTQCGVYIEQDADFSVSLSQEKYVDELKYINIRAHRRKEKHAETDDYEKSQLRSLLGESHGMLSRWPHIFRLKLDYCFLKSIAVRLRL